MSDPSALLLASLNPATRKEAEQNLHSLSKQHGFLPHLLKLILDSSQDRAARLAASVYLKNVIKNRWDDDGQPIPAADQVAIRADILDAMISLSNPTDKGIRAQLAEAISLIAAVDFPERWEDLMDKLVSSLSTTDFNVNLAILETAHSIFTPWRSQTRTDELYTIINYVLSRFVDPFLQFFRQTATTLYSSPPSDLPIVGQAMVTLTAIFYDLTSQDLPPAIEDSHPDFFAPDSGWFSRFMVWDPPELRGDPNDPTPSIPAQLKTTTVELVELYLHKYPEMLSQTKTVEAFVQIVWNILGNGQLQAAADDAFVSQALHFISTAIRSNMYRDVFSAKDTVSNLIQGVVVPNISLRDYEVEQFEDEALAFIRQDVSFASAGGALGDVLSRRQAAADIVRALVSTGSEVETTEVVGQWVTTGLQQYAADPGPGGNWKAKDSAVYLLTAVATKASTMQHGVTSTNALVNVVEFFSNNVFQDLQAPAGTIHPILQVDAIRFLYTFRMQLSKEQLLVVLPILLQHLSSDNTVSYTYAAIAIERILFIRRGTQLLFTQADIRDFGPTLIDVLLSRVEAGGSAQKVAENDYLMRCAMRVIVTARQTLMPVYQQILQRLVNILGIVSQNPSNPSFDQYIFESTSALIRFIVGARRSTLPVFEGALFGPITIILQQDVEQYIPYVFQILAQMLELHTVGAPTEYRGLLTFLVQAPVWAQKGNVPALVKLLKAFLKNDTAYMVESGMYIRVLAVVQQRLVPSRNQDSWGFELLNAVIAYIPPSTMVQWFRPLVVALLNRMQTSKTDKYVYNFTHFFMFAMSAKLQGLSPDLVVGTFHETQPGLWSNVLTNIILPQIPKMPHKDRKMAAVGLTKMLTDSEKMLIQPNIEAWPASFATLAKLFQEPQYLTSSRNEREEDTGFTEIDYEEQTAGYQAAYSRLAASEVADFDPVARIKDPLEFVVRQLMSRRAVVGELIAAAMQADPSVVPFVEGLRRAGLAL